MSPCAGFVYGLWWVFPLVIIVMMVFCFFTMMGRMGSMMCRPGFRSSGSHAEGAPDSVLDIVNKRYAKGDVNKEEDDEKREVIDRHD